MATGPIQHAATHAYRAAVALAVSGAAPLATAQYVVFGEGSEPYSPETSTAMDRPFAQSVADCSVDGVTLIVRGKLTGAQAAGRVVREVGVVASDGTLMGRRVVAPKELEPETEYEFTLRFEY